MSAQILSGKEPAAKLLASLKPLVAELNPKMVVVQAGDDPASTTYITHKMKAAAEIGLRAEHTHLPDTVTYLELLSVISDLNKDPDVSGFIIQLPLPAHLHAMLPQIVREIDPKKDIDGFTAYNLGKVFLSTEFEHLPPATPAGVITLLEHYNIALEGKHAVVVGHSNLVGKPLAVMLLNRLATVTVCHVKTHDLASHTRQADILCSAVGKLNLITADMVKPGAVVIDIGVTKDEEGLRGDTDYEHIKDIASAITPVPGGVGPMTVASLIRNCVHAKERQVQR
jgi:methylenetetrahydrofolate dehydrogenase (NADP+)/methenyltetrahydrofolate cyclohydrolase